MSEPIIFPNRKHCVNDIEFALDVFDFMLWHENDAIREPKLDARISYSHIQVFLGDGCRFGRDKWLEVDRWVYPIETGGHIKYTMHHPDGTTTLYKPTTDDMMGADWYMLKPQYAPRTVRG